MDSARIMRWKPLSTTILDDYPNRHSPTDSADETANYLAQIHGGFWYDPPLVTPAEFLNSVR